MSEGKLDSDDFKSLRQLWVEGKNLDVAVKLKEWEKKPKTKVAQKLYQIWIRRTGPQKIDYSASHQFESDIRQALEISGFVVQRTGIVDYLAHKGDIHFVVECKHSTQPTKIYEGISQLLYYKWRTNDNFSSLLLMISGKCDDPHLLEFAKSLGVIIWEESD